MLKELQEIFKRDNLFAQAMRDSQTMLEKDEKLFAEAVKSLRERDTTEIEIDIWEKDREINDYEREVRKKVLTHLAVSGPMDISAGLMLTSVVIDIERIGDYTKNVVELAMHHPNRLDAGRFEEELKGMESVILSEFRVLVSALKESDKETARKTLDDLWRVTKRCDQIVFDLIEEEDHPFHLKDGVTLALYLRYLKRIGAHLMNIASGIVNPFHRIGYREKQVDSRQ